MRMMRRLKRQPRRGMPDAATFPPLPATAKLLYKTSERSILVGQAISGLARSAALAGKLDLGARHFPCGMTVAFESGPSQN
jgi:hypothetical protein